MLGWLPDPIGTGTYRSLLPWEHRRYADHLLRLSAKDRRTRFMGSVSDDFIRGHAKRATTSAKSKVIGWFTGGTLRGAVEIAWSSRDAAEAAFSVEAMLRRQGVGTALASRALRAARNRGIRELIILTEADNAGMRRLGARFGASFVCDGREVEGMMPTGDASLLSVVMEVAEEQQSIAVSVRPLWMAQA